MRRTNFNMRARATGVALFATTMMLAVSCGGSANKKKAADGVTETAQTETRVPKGVGKMAAFDFVGTDAPHRSSITEFENITGLANIGKPVGYKMRGGVGFSSSTVGIDFITEGEITQQDIDDYARAVWDLTKKVSKVPPYNYKDEPLKSFDDARKKQSEPYYHYLWYYSTAEQRFRVGIYAEKHKIEDDMRLRLLLEFNPLKK